MGETVIRQMTIVNERGLHARASGALSQLCETFEAEAIVRFDGEEADACSIMDLLTLAATVGSVIEVEATGPDAVGMVDAMEAMIVNKFNEGR
jgi:phosphocarrier protein